MLVTLDAKELLAAARLAYDKDQIRSWCKCEHCNEKKADKVA